MRIANMESTVGSIQGGGDQVHGEDNRTKTPLSSTHKAKPTGPPLSAQKITSKSHRKRSLSPSIYGLSTICPLTFGNDLDNGRSQAGRRDLQKTLINGLGSSRPAGVQMITSSRLRGRPSSWRREVTFILHLLTLFLTLAMVLPEVAEGVEAGGGYSQVKGDVYNASQFKLNCPPHILEGVGADFSSESRLINCLLDKYAKVTTLARPVTDSSASVVIEFGISLIQILDFDEIKQVLTTSMWKNYVWVDQVLRWDPSDFGDVTHIRLPATHLWTPDIVLYNKFGGEGYAVNLGYGLTTGSTGHVQRTHIADEQTKQHEELVAVYYNGTVKWIPPAIYRSSCEINMQDFPFDEQTCIFKFGSWTYDEYKVDLRLYEDRHDIDLREYLRSSEWDILNTSGVRNIRRYPFFDTDPYPEIIFYLTMRRQSTFYIYLLVLPCILLSCLTLVLFWIPAQRPDRTAVGMSLFSSFFILLLILVQSSPPTSASISRLGIHYCVNMVLIAVSTVLSVVIINIGKASDGEVAPKWLMAGCLYKMARLLCIKVNRAVMNNSPYDEASENGVYLECLNGSGVERHSQFTVRDKAVRNFDVAHRWHTLAGILDRCFFIVYLIALVTSTIFIFPSDFAFRDSDPPS